MFCPRVCWCAQDALGDNAEAGGVGVRRTNRPPPSWGDEDELTPHQLKLLSPVMVGEAAGRAGMGPAARTQPSPRCGRQEFELAATTTHIHKYEYVDGLAVDEPNKLGELGGCKTIDIERGDEDV